MKNPKTTVSTIIFKNVISARELPLFRGAFILEMKKLDTNKLSHNHLDDDSLRYRYPLIQYKKSQEGNAAITLLNEGNELMPVFFCGRQFEIRLGNKYSTFEIDRIELCDTIIEVHSEQRYQYILKNWLPFNDNNFRRYQKLNGDIPAQCELLEGILVGNILSMAKGLGIFLNDIVECDISMLQQQPSLEFKGVKMESFTIEFCTNIALPQYIGLGKGSSLGFGTITRL